MKDHEIREFVNALTAVAKEYANTQQLRERIHGVVLTAMYKDTQTVVKNSEEGKAMPRDEDDDDHFLEWGRDQLGKNLKPLQRQAAFGRGEVHPRAPVEYPGTTIRTRFILEAMKAYIQRGGYNTEETALAAVRTADATLKAAAQKPE